MSKKTAELKLKIQEKNAEVKSVLGGLQDLSLKRTEGPITDAEIEQWRVDNAKHDELLRDLAALSAELVEVQKAEEIVRNAHIASGVAITQTPQSLKQDVKKHFSLSKMVMRSDEQLMAEAKDFTHDFGFTDEMHQEFQNEVKRYKLPIDSNAIGAPESVMRAMSATGDVVSDVPTKGGVTVDTTLDSNVLRLFRNANDWKALGASVNTGLKANYELIKEGSVLVAGWKGEIDEAPLTDKTYNTVTMTPNRLTAQTLYSRQLLIQSTLSVDAELRRDLFMAADDVLMNTLINGSANIEGLLTNPNVSLLQAGPDANTGGALTYEKIVAMFSQLGASNAKMEGTAFLSNYKVSGSLMSTKKDAGSGKFVMESFDSLMSRPFRNNNFVPDDISKGSSAANLSALILAHFPDINVSQWGGFTLINDPYTKAGNSQIRLVMDTFWDMLIRQAKAHVVYKDVVATI